MKPLSFPRSYRMNESHEFARLFDSPRVYRGRVSQVFWKENGLPHPRLGITIKGRLSSIWRARVKRQVREWFRTNPSFRQSHLFLASDFNVVFRAPKEMNWQSVETLCADLRRMAGDRGDDRYRG